MQPDVTALSVDTLAARKKENSFVLMSRAPMSSPHVSCIASLIKKIGQQPLFNPF